MRLEVTATLRCKATLRVGGYDLLSHFCPSISLAPLDAAGRVAQPDEDIAQGVGNAVERHLPVATPCQVVAIDGRVRQ